MSTSEELLSFSVRSSIFFLDQKVLKSTPFPMKHHIFLVTIDWFLISIISLQSSFHYFYRFHNWMLWQDFRILIILEHSWGRVLLWLKFNQNGTGKGRIFFRFAKLWWSIGKRCCCQRLVTCFFLNGSSQFIPICLFPPTLCPFN